jgi:dihydrofolate reductase
MAQSISPSVLLTYPVGPRAVARTWAEELSMGKLIYAATVSLDGFLEDESGSFDWSVPDEQVHAFWNEQERHIVTSLYGRRMYETMRVWERDDWLTNQPAVVREYAGIWRDTDKIIYSASLTNVSTARTRIERQFEPAAVRRLKETSASNLSIGGAGIAGEAFRHGLVDECVLLLCPVLVGGGKPALPPGVRLDLQLLDQGRFDNGVVYVRHAVRPPA